MVATSLDVLYVNIKKKHEVDIDNLYRIGEIRNIIYLNKKFYVFANK